MGDSSNNACEDYFSTNNLKPGLRCNREQLYLPKLVNYGTQKKDT